MSKIDRFIQRTGTAADITFTGDHAFLYQNHVRIAQSTNGVFHNVAEGDGYVMKIVAADHSVSTEHIAIGAIVDAMGQSNMTRWFGYSYETRPAPHTYELHPGEVWGSVLGGAARLFTAELSDNLNCPVAIVDSAAGGTALLAADANKTIGWWLNGPLFQDAENTIDSIGGKVEAVLWAQGEADADRHVSASAYDSGLRAFFANVEAAFGAPHIYIQEIGDTTALGLESYFVEIRAIEDRVASTLQYVSIGAKENGLDLLDGGPHYQPDAYLTLANEMANSIYHYETFGNL